MQEARELANDPCTDYTAAPLEVRNLLSEFTSYSNILCFIILGRYICEFFRSSVSLL